MYLKINTCNGFKIEIEMKGHGKHSLVKLALIRFIVTCHMRVAVVSQRRRESHTGKTQCSRIETYLLVI